MDTSRKGDHRVGTEAGGQRRHVALSAKPFRNRRYCEFALASVPIGISLVNCTDLSSMVNERRRDVTFVASAAAWRGN